MTSPNISDDRVLLLHRLQSRMKLLPAPGSICRDIGCFGFGEAGKGGRRPHGMPGVSVSMAFGMRVFSGWFKTSGIACRADATQS